MDIQAQLDAFMKASRQEELAQSDQLLLWEIILKLESVKNKSLPVEFDIPWYKPYGIWSWRGIYAELAIYTNKVGSIQTWKMLQETWWEYAEHEALWKENPNVVELIANLKKCIGGTFTWYKGGDFTMGKNTPVSVCRANNDSWFYYDEENYKNTWITDVKEEADKVILITWREND